MGLFRYSVNLSWGGSGSPGVNVFHGRTANDVGPFDDLTSLINSIKTMYTGFAQFYPAGVTISGSPEVIMDFDSSPTYESVTPWTVAGGASNPAYLPPASAVVLGWRTSSATRRGRGRTFLSPLSAGTAETNGTPTAGMLSSLNTITNTFLNSFDGALGGAWGVYSAKDGVLRDYVSCSVKDKYAVLTSRRD